MGVAWTFDSSNVFFSSIKGSQFEHKDFLDSIITEDCTVYVEELNFFRNAKTVRSLLLKTGYVVYSSSRTPIFVKTKLPRKHLFAKGKEEVYMLVSAYASLKNNDESDAIALLLYAIGKQLSEVKLERWTK
jgi:hypothetical protein